MSKSEEVLSEEKRESLDKIESRIREMFLEWQIKSEGFGIAINTPCSGNDRPNVQ